jgi:uncharacterized OB-fold protein
VLHSLFLLQQANDLLITAQAKQSPDPELGTAIAQLQSVISKMKCKKCDGFGYLPDRTPCPKCLRTGKAKRRDTTTLRA